MATENNNDKAPVLGELTADIVSAYVANNAVPAGELPGLIASVHGALSRAPTADAPESKEDREPAVSRT